MTGHWPQSRTDALSNEQVLACALAVLESTPVPMQAPPYLKQDLWGKPLLCSEIMTTVYTPNDSSNKKLILEIPSAVDLITVITQYCVVTQDVDFYMPFSQHDAISFVFELDGVEIPNFQPSRLRCNDPGTGASPYPRVWQETHLVYLPKQVLRIYYTHPSPSFGMFVVGAAVSGWRYAIRNSAEPSASLTGGAYDAGRR